jgi:diguanylate cyclase (GGDEF)-like protein
MNPVLVDSLTSLPDSVVYGPGPLAKLIREKALHAVFQPIADLQDGSIYAHEALIRGPVMTPLHSPDALLKAARKEKLLHEFEVVCVLVAIRRWGQLKQPGRLFVNMSADALVRAVKQRGSFLLSNLIRSLGVSPRMLVIEITEHERVTDMEELARVVAEVHDTGVSLALDDFGDGRSSLRLWSQIKPDIVKIDKYFTKDISNHADNLKTIQALMLIAEIFGTALVAEGVENEDDLRVLRDLKISFGQGYFLRRPSADVFPVIEAVATDVLVDRRVAVMPELGQIARQGHLRHFSIIEAPTVSLKSTNDEVAAIFLAKPDLHATAIVTDERPVGLINRQQFMNQYATLYFREVFGKKSCAMMANQSPRLVERDHDIDELVGILTSQDQRYLTEGFIATENGRYLGLGTGDQLVRSVTEVRLEAARHANPLTFLPGNIPISLHIKRLLESGTDFAACYADLNHFKPFNDFYGFWRGDEMIRLLAKLSVAHCDPQRDFVGHVGGDDFLILYQSEDWESRCNQLIADFARQAQGLFDESALSAGGIEAEDRNGVNRFFPFTTLSIGAVVVSCNQYRSAEEVATQAALAKHEAKLAKSGFFVSRAVEIPVARAA